MSRLNATLNLQSLCHRLVVLVRFIATPVPTGLNVSFDLQTASRCLVVVRTKAASSHGCFDFHRVFLSLRLIAASAAAYLYRRKRNAKLLAGKNVFGTCAKIYSIPRWILPLVTAYGDERRVYQPRSRGRGDAVQRQHAYGEGQI